MTRTPTYKEENVKYTKRDLLEFLKCKEDPVHFIKTYYTVQHPHKGAIKLDLHPYQEDVIRAYEEHRFNIVLPARQVGSTAITCGYLLWYAMFHNDKQIFAGAEKNVAAMELMQRMRFAYEELPFWFKSLISVGEDGWNKHEISFDNGSRIIARTMSSCAACGITISLLYMDSFAFVKPEMQHEFWTSMLPTISSGSGKCIIASTPNKDNDTFANLWRKASDGENGFNPIHIPWNAPEGRDENFKKDFVEMLGELRWRQQYECEFLAE
jgi:hypothetical protein